MSLWLGPMIAPLLRLPPVGPPTKSHGSGA